MTRTLMIAALLLSVTLGSWNGACAQETSLTSGAKIRLIMKDGQEILGHFSSMLFLNHREKCPIPPVEGISFEMSREMSHPSC